MYWIILHRDVPDFLEFIKPAHKPFSFLPNIDFLIPPFQLELFRSILLLRLLGNSKQFL